MNVKGFSNMEKLYAMNSRGVSAGHSVKDLPTPQESNFFSATSLRFGFNPCGALPPTLC
jgi:hypothetical protein